MKLIAITVLIGILLLMPLGTVSYAQKSTIKYAQDFDYNTQNVFNQLFIDCPAGIVLYKLNGQTVVVCMITSTYGNIINKNVVDIDVINKKIIHKDSSNSDDSKDDGPDGDCLYNASLPKCNPDSDGNCPDGFNMNEDGNCFPDHHEDGCPDGTHGVDDDETGQCYPDSDGCPDGMHKEGNNCTYDEEDDTPLPPVVNTSDEQSNEEEDNTDPVSTEDLESQSDDEATPQEDIEQEDNNDSSSTDEDSNEEESNN